MHQSKKRETGAHVCTLRWTPQSAGIALYMRHTTMEQNIWERWEEPDDLS